MKPYGTTASATSAPVRFKREMTRHPGKPFPRCPVHKEYRFDGQGGFAPNSGRIPLRAIPGAIATIAIFCLFAFVGAAVFQ